MVALVERMRVVEITFESDRSGFEPRLCHFLTSYLDSLSLSFLKVRLVRMQGSNENVCVTATGNSVISVHLPSAGKQTHVLVEMQRRNVFS